MKTLVLSVGIFLLAFSKLPGATVYVSPVSTNPTPPYATWATAATGIQAGLDAAPQGGVVLVTNGAYAGGLVISKPLTLLSINGPAFTVIDGRGSNRCVSMTDGASMSGFTLTHGVAANGGGVGCNSTNAYLTNCMIVSNVATNGNGGGAYNGTLYNCLLSSNSVVSELGVGGGAYESGLYNCTVVGNTASFAGGVSSFSAIYNCIDCYNTAPVYPNFSDRMRLNYCCTAPMPTSGVGNITNAPAFVDLHGGDFRLPDFSPCVNAGNNAFAFGATDLAGNPRLSGGTVDMGAYEYQFSGPPSIFSQPYSQSVYGGSEVDFSVGSVGAMPLSWQWQTNGIPIPFATSSSLVLASVKTNQAGAYSIVITNSLGSITSQVAVLTVRDSPPILTYQPASQTVTVGSNVTFTAAALGSLPLSWQWSFNGNPIRDATNSDLTLPAVRIDEGGSYFVVVTNSLGLITSQVAILTVLAGPSITIQPLSRVVLAGSNVTFTTSAIGNLPLSWQWEFNGTAIPQATASSLTLASVTTNQAGGYSVVVTNTLGSVTSQVAVLTVLSGLTPGTKYVWLNSPTPTAPYTNWATAAHTIQDAVDVGFPGDAILVTNGVYATGSRAGVDGTPARLVVTTVLALRSINGPEFTIIDGAGTNQCVAMTNGVSLSGFTLTNGSAFWGGGAMAYYPGNGLLTNCVLTGNQAYGIGGGAQFCTLYDCTLTGNGGSLSNGAAAAYCTLYNCYLTGNSSSGYGAAAAWACNLYSCALTDNASGGAASSTLYNCTVAGNQGLGVYGSALYNCIVYYNRSPYGPNYYGVGFIFNYLDSSFNYCCTTPMPTNGVGNITNEPSLVTDWRLSSTSPCLGAGSSAYALGVDLDAEPWRKPPAIGCDEYYTGSLTGALSVASTASWMTVPTGFTVVFDGAITGRASDSRWEFGDGTVESNRLHTSHAWLATGNYNVVLRAYNSDYSAGVTAALIVRVVAQAPVVYVDANSPNPVAPYTSWSTAARNIQDAIAAVSVPQSLVLVTNGTYPGGVTVTNPIKLISVNGPVFTVVDGGGTNLCLSLNTNVSVSGFTVTNGSAGVSCVSSNAYLTNCVLVGNSSGGGTQGGTLYKCMLSNNSGSGASSATLYNCTLSSNAPSLNGIGAFNCTLYNCDLTANGGGAAAWSCLLYNCALTGNAQDGADYSTLYNCTLTANGNLAASGSKLYNCIAYYNPPSGGPNYDNSCTLNYCCTVPMPTNGVGNITNEPALAGSWRLSPVSPCRGAGSATYSSGVDLDGEPWLNPPSIGCDEFYSESVTGILSATITADWTNVSTDFIVSFDSQIFGNASVIRWEFGDGTIESNRLHTTHAWLSPGDYTVVLRAFNNDHPAGVTTQVLVRVLATPLYYVDLNSTNPGAPYLNWATAATNIQDAVSVALVPGSLVLVNNGVYRFGGRLINGLLTNRVAVEMPITVRSVNGPGATVIQGYQVPGTTNGDSAVRCVYLSNGAVLSGFTLTNGATQAVYEYDIGNGGGVYCQSSESTVTNCTLVGNAAFLGGGAASGGSIKACTLAGNLSFSDGGGAFGSTLENCVLSGNTSFSTGGGAFSCTLLDCTLEGNQATYSGGAQESLLDRCRVIGNVAQSGGGVGWPCTVRNSILVNNSASTLSGGGAESATLYNCTLVGNSAANTSSGGGADNCTLYNCIAYYNSRGNYSASTLEYCSTTPLPSNGVGNITNAPLFVNQASGDFRLQSNSPCINAGNNAFVFGGTDLDGNPRVVGGTVDIGAYEYQSPSSILSFAWLQQWGLPTDGSADYADTDGDGMNNWQEWVCGTCPTNALSVLRLLSASPAGGNVTVSWQSVSGINYFLERSADLASSFMGTSALYPGANPGIIPTNTVLVATNISGLLGTTTFTDTNVIGAGPFFYRVGVRVGGVSQ